MGSHTHTFPPIPILAGDVIATSVGVAGNVGMDWGVYDLRQMNEASNDDAWLELHAGEQAPYAQCWLTMLPDEEEKILQSLPAGDQKSGSQSDYCK